MNLDPTDTPGLGTTVSFISSTSSAGTFGSTYAQRVIWNDPNNNNARVLWKIADPRPGGQAAGRTTIRLAVVRANRAGANANIANPVLLAAFQNDPNLNPTRLSVIAINGVPADVDATVTTANGGHLTVLYDGSLSYAPATGFTGTDSIDYTVSDGTAQETGILNIGVSANTIAAIDPSAGDFNSNATGLLALTTSATTTSTATALSASPAYNGEAVTLTATVTPSGTTSNPPTGWVDFYDPNGIYLGQGQINSSGVATFTLCDMPIGTDKYSAVYSGDLNFAASFASVNETVSMDNTTATLTTSGSASYGQAVVLTANVRQPTRPSRRRGSLIFMRTAS